MKLFGRFRHVAIEDAGRLERRLQRVQQREAAAEAEADHAGASSVHLGPLREPRARRLEVREGRPLAAAEREEGAQHAEHFRRSRVEEVRRQRHVAEIGDARRDAADVVVQAEDLVDHDDRRPSRAVGRPRERRPHRPPGGRREGEVLDRRHAQALPTLIA